jgi:hypothetical protein
MAVLHRGDVRSEGFSAQTSHNRGFKSFLFNVSQLFKLWLLNSNFSSSVQGLLVYGVLWPTSSLAILDGNSLALSVQRHTPT